LSVDELRALLVFLQAEQARVPTEYRAGYVDAIRYVLDWMEEDDAQEEA
jgi:hypothetical protein